MIQSINFKFRGETTPISNYNENKTNIGTLIRQYSGVTNVDNFIGPKIIGLARPIEASTSIPVKYPHVIQINDTYDHVYLADNAIAAATRRLVLYEYNKITSQYNWLGFVTLTFPPTTVHTIRGFRMSLDNYTAGTVTVNSTTVSGISTSWSTDRLSSGTRIGFGSTNPSEITTWYEIQSINNDTSITLTSSAGIISNPTSYVIQDYIAIVVTTNATLANGGLFVVKGLRPEIFTNAGTTIPAAVSTDNIRAVYWLADAATVTNTVAGGCGLGERISWTDKRIYVLDRPGASTSKIYVYNFRKALTLSSGKDTTTPVLITGNQGVSGTISQENNGRVGALNHGVANGVESLFFVTTTRVYRCVLSGITNGSTTFITDSMVEIPPGGVNTYTLTSVLSSCEIASGIDRLLVMTTGAGGVRSYVTEYKTDSSPFDIIFLVDDKQLDQSSADSNGVIHPAINILPFSVWSEGGILHLCRISTAQATNQIYSLPINSHQTFAFQTNQYIITPKFDISTASKLYDITVSSLNRLGSDTFSLPLEPFKVYYRTNGISDNSGSWTEIDRYGDLSGVNGNEIQFAFTFKILGGYCIPSRIFGFTLTYEDNNTDSHYEPSVGNSSVSNRIFAYRQSVLWGSNIPDMRIRIYNISNGNLLIDDTVSDSSFGVWEYSSNSGTTWNPWSSSQDVVGNYIRYTATSLPDGIKVRVLLTQ